MFWKRSKDGGTATPEKPGKVKKLSPRDLAAQELDQIAPGEHATYRLGKTYLKPYITIIRNPEYPGKGKKYSVLQDGMNEEGEPANKPGRFWDTNEAREIAGWLLEREGVVVK